MKIKDLQRELAELLIFLAEYYTDMEQEVDLDLISRIYYITDKAN